MNLYKTIAGDRIDLIVTKHYGDLEHLNAVVEANISLCKSPMILEAGITIKLPKFDKKSVVPGTVTKTERKPLW